MPVKTKDLAISNEHAEDRAHSAPTTPPIAGSDVVIGALIGLDAKGKALVAYPGSPSIVGMPAMSTVSLKADDIGREIALLFENGDPERPLIIGRVHHVHDLSSSALDLVDDTTRATQFSGSVDGERIEFKANEEIVLRCGKASITLTKAGKILIRGTYLMSRSSGANRVKGGSIQLN